MLVTIPPPRLQDLPGELAGVVALLHDPAFFAPYQAHFSEVLGRPSSPVETYLRIMSSSTATGWGYRTLCREVAEPISWSQFYRISPGSRAAAIHPGQDHRPVRPECGRGTEGGHTVVAANVAYPTHSGLLARAISLIVSLVARIHAAGAASRTTVRDRRRARRPAGPVHLGAPETARQRGQGRRAGHHR